MSVHLTRSLRLLAVLGLVLGLTLGATPGRVAADDDRCEIIDDDGDQSTDGFCDDQAIVRLVPGANLDEFNDRFETEVITGVPSRNLYLLQLPSGSSEPDVVRTLEADPDTVWAELNFANQVPEGRPQRFYVSGDPIPGGPGESYAPQLLGVEAANACATGRRVTVAVIDTGIDADHPVFAGRLIAGRNVLPDGPANAFRDIGNGNDDDGDGFVDEMTGHGTHVAGIVVQVAPEVRILPIRALDSDGAGDAFYLAAALYHAIDRRADVINLSLGSTHNARVVSEAVIEAVGGGIIVPAAAGNENRQDPAEFPAAGGRAVAVAATDARDRKSSFSNFHPQVDLSAPGTNIVSAFPGGSYVTWNGTSMATPWVSGASALLLAENPDWTGRMVGNRLARTAVDLGERNPNHVGLLGAGRLDVGAAVGCRE